MYREGYAFEGDIVYKKMRFRVTIRRHRRNFSKPYDCYLIKVFDPISSLCIMGELYGGDGLKYYKYLVNRMESKLLETITKD